MPSNETQLDGGDKIYLRAQLNNISTSIKLLVQVVKQLDETAHVFTVSALPAAGTQGRRYLVTDANATTFNSIVAAGGSNKVPVFDDGTNWRIG